MRFCIHCQRCFDDAVSFCTEHRHEALSEPHAGGPGMIKGYRLDRLLESGIKGDLYRAQQIECGQYCRIRVISPGKKNGNQLLREAKHAAALYHPNLVDVYEAGTLAGGECYVVSEEPKGETLREHLDRAGVPPLLTTIRLAEQIAEAVHVLHQEGLLHRALKPENIILASDDKDRMQVRIKELDFGGAIERSIISNKFLIDTALDSVRYFAPEQCTGGRTSVQTDVYSLGIILYEMLAGAPPFDAPKASGLIEKHRHQQAADVRIDNFDLRMLLTHTLNESLQKLPENRHSSAGAFARQLRHMEQLATHVSTPPPAIVVPPAPSTKAFAARAAAADTVAREIAEPPVEPEMPLVDDLVAETEQFVPESVSDGYDPWSDTELYTAHGYESVSDPAVEFESEDVESAVAPPPETEHDEHLLRKARLDRASRSARARLRRNRADHSSQMPLIETDPSTTPPSPEIVDHREPVPSGQPEPPAETPPDFVEPDADEITAVTARSRPLVIEWQQPDDDIPSIEDVIEELSKKNVEPVFALDRPIEPAEPKPARRRASFSAKPTDEIQFFPSVMRKSDENGSLDLFPNYSILSGAGAAQARFSIDYQTIVLGVGLITLVLLFFIGNSMFRQYTQTQLPAAEPSIESVFNQPAQPQTAQVDPNKKTAKAFQKTKPDVGGTNSVASPATANDTRTAASPNGAVQDPPAKNAAQGRNSAKASSVSSTLVISTQNGKVKSTLETGKRAADKKPSLATNRVTGTTRPRIVKMTSP